MGEGMNYASSYRLLNWARHKWRAFFVSNVFQGCSELEGTVNSCGLMESTPHLWIIVLVVGLAFAVLFGAVTKRTGVYAIGAVSDVVNMGEWGRQRTWLLAIVVAILGANLLSLIGIVDLGQSMYTAARFTVVPDIAKGYCSAWE
jgi:hypothetical protein